MPTAAERKSVYGDLLDLPDNVTGEILHGELHALPRPSFKHAQAASILGMRIGTPFSLGEGGPGGWWILFEPEIQLGEHILVPDLGGWRRERLPSPPQTNYCSIAPDWVCEILSPASTRVDRIVKMPIYGEFHVPYIWLIDPVARTLEVFELDAGRWVLHHAASQDDKVRAAPFEAIEFDLAALWWD